MARPIAVQRGITDTNTPRNLPHPDSLVTTAASGPGGELPRYALSRSMFVRAIGLVYTIAFASLAVQVRGLVGEHGILPIGDFLTAVHGALGLRAFHQVPTLLWIAHGDAVLVGMMWLGAVGGLVVLAGFAPRCILAVLWLLYLSISAGGQAFLQFQWDALLLEAGLVALVYAPAGWRPRWTETEPPPLARWLAWWLCFRLMFLSGITKLLSGDPTWRDLTALHYHYWTQPLPNPVAWYAATLPASLLDASTFVMFVIEIAAPLLILAPGRWRLPRRIACILLALLQAGIAVTGNYGFFNLLALVLCLSLLDDDALRRLVPPFVRRRNLSIAARSVTRIPGDEARASAHRGLRPLAFGSVVCVMFALGGIAFLREMLATAGRPESRWMSTLLAPVAPFSSFNGYGLFRVMTTERPEIVIERSDDGETWTEIAFPYKPGDVMRAPPFVAPHMPRLDWQMWFAALDPRSATGWLVPFLERILEGKGPAAALVSIERDDAPRFVRLAYYRYHFSNASLHRATGAWWTREFVDYLTQPLSLEDLRPRSPPPSDNRGDSPRE
jgi:lipase maturation factor 1